MLVAHRHANETLVLLQCAANTAYGSMLAMHSDATTDPSAAPAAPAPPVVRLDADLTVVRGELATVRAERDQLRGVLTTCWLTLRRCGRGSPIPRPSLPPSRPNGRRRTRN